MTHVYYDVPSKTVYLCDGPREDLLGATLISVYADDTLNPVFLVQSLLRRRGVTEGVTIISNPTIDIHTEETPDVHEHGPESEEAD